MNKPYSDHPIYQAMSALLAQNKHLDAQAAEIQLADAGGSMKIRCGLHPGFTDEAFVITGSSGGDDFQEVYFLEEGFRAARQLAAALSAWADWDEARYCAPIAEAPPSSPKGGDA